MNEKQYSLHTSHEFTKALNLEQTEPGGAGPGGIERIELLENKDGDVRVLAHAELLSIQEPIKIFYVSWIYAYPKKTSSTASAGKKILREVNAFLDSKHIPGILYNDTKRKGGERFYKQAKWNELAGHPGWMTYRVPENSDSALIEQAINKIESLDPRLKDSFKNEKIGDIEKIGDMTQFKT